MAFADWKKRNTIMNSSIPAGYQAMAYRVAQAAYKAGERDAEKRMEDLCMRAMELQDKLRGRNA